jgi:hypothetical protein
MQLIAGSSLHTQQREVPIEISQRGFDLRPFRMA